MATSVEEVVNQALDRIGWTETVNNIYDGTRAARVALNLYVQTRDDLLREFDWGFAERMIGATLLKAAPDGGYVAGVTPWDPALYPPLDARFEYAYPADCLKVRSIKSAPVFVPNFDPQPRSFRIANDAAFVPARKVILCSVENAILVYTGQVVDPATWEANFTEALVVALAKRMTAPLAALQANERAEQIAAREEAGDTMIAEMEQG